MIQKKKTKTGQISARNSSIHLKYKTKDIHEATTPESVAAAAGGAMP